MLLEDRWIDRTLDLRGSRYNPAGEWILLYNISRISSHLLASISTKFIIHPFGYNIYRDEAIVDDKVDLLVVLHDQSSNSKGLF